MVVIEAENKAEERGTGAFASDLKMSLQVG